MENVRILIISVYAISKDIKILSEDKLKKILEIFINVFIISILEFGSIIDVLKQKIF